MTKNLPAREEARFQFLCQEDPLEKETATHSIFLPGKSHGQRSLRGTFYGVAKSWRQLHVKTTTNRELYMTILEEEKDRVLIPVGSRFNMLMETEI